MLGFLAAEGIGPKAIHDHALALQERFINGIMDLTQSPLAAAQLVVPLFERNRGNFLTFQTPNAADLYERLLAAKIITDHRANRLRLGFGIYQDEDDVGRFLERLASLAR